MPCATRSITGARYTMRATIIRPGGIVVTDSGTGGTWIEDQDKDTGEVIRVWVPIADDPATSENESNTVEIKCWARGIVDGGIRAAATTESFDDIYRNVDIINMWIPKQYKVTKRDRITNIRSKNGTVLWRDEENEVGSQVTPTVFNVNGVIPVFDPFNNHIDNFCLLERAEV